MPSGIGCIVLASVVFGWSVVTMGPVVTGSTAVVVVVTNVEVVVVVVVVDVVDVVVVVTGSAVVELSTVGIGESKAKVWGRIHAR